MVDVLTREQRSFNMTRIRSKDTKPEVVLRKLLSRRGVKGYRKYYKIVGNPDLVFPRVRLAVFVDGCFWHKCKKCFVEPQTRKDFWLKKIEGNVRRDKDVNRRLRKNGWKVLRFWEHEIKKVPDGCLKRVVKKLK